ncbi:MAG TPA: pyrroline-5-carboxylate reductase [Gammaproteobacteria bacterium]|jgi:pyrroline-5-carboxylate reductase|nr:pyrroline-5-carboxylate reductase [Gammaproteobacteria bacterium]
MKQNNTNNIAIIGAGNMGSSLIAGLIKNNHPSNKLWAADPSQEKLDYLQQHFHIHTSQENHLAIQAAEVIILAVKPQMLAEVAKNLQPILTAQPSQKPLIISIAAGIREANLQQWLGQQTAIVRAMPNTAAMIGCGATALHANAHVTPAQRNMAESILRAVGVAVWLTDEAQMDSVTALSGSGPAYFFLIMEALQEAAEQLGLPAETARLLTLQTALGAARMAMESETAPAELRQKVTSPGGTTEKAISVLEQKHIRDIFKQALLAAKQRSEELAG